MVNMVKESVSILLNGLWMFCLRQYWGLLDFFFVLLVLWKCILRKVLEYLDVMLSSFVIYIQKSVLGLLMLIVVVMLMMLLVFIVVVSVVVSVWNWEMFLLVLGFLCVSSLSCSVDLRCMNCRLFRWIVRYSFVLRSSGIKKNGFQMNLLMFLRMDWRVVRFILVFVGDGVEMLLLYLQELWFVVCVDGCVGEMCIQVWQCGYQQSLWVLIFLRVILVLQM